MSSRVAIASRRLLVLVFVTACARRGGGASSSETVPKVVFDRGAVATPSSGAPAAAPDRLGYRPGPAGFPIPEDAATLEDTPPDHTFEIDRKQTAIVAELRVDLAQSGFSIDSEYVEDSVHTHWYITRDNVHYEVTVAGDARDHTLIILTVD